VNGQAAQQSTATNFVANPVLSSGTNTVTVVATNGNNVAQTNSYQVVVPAQTSITRTYDLNGNLTNNGNGQTYAWDAENRLITITYTGGATSNYAYDALGRRASIIEKNSSGTVTSTKQFVLCGSMPCEERDATGTTATKRFFGQGEQISGTSYYFTKDHLGSTREVTDSSGTIQAQYDYDPNGNATLLAGSNIADFQFAGYYEHQPSGLNLTTYRGYDPTTARWLNRDPIGESGGLNLYDYCGNDPVNGSDPSGLFNAGAFGYGVVEGIAYTAGTLAIITAVAAIGTPLAVAGAAGLAAGAATYGLISAGEFAYNAYEGNLTDAQFSEGLGNIVGGLIVGGTAAQFRVAGGAPCPKPLRRAYLRIDTMIAILENVQTDANGKIIDPNTKLPTDNPVRGHKPGFEFWRLQADATARGLTQSQFNDEQNDPDLYQIEDRDSNASHRYELPP
jgi:RHS repeat-associated protein